MNVANRELCQELYELSGWEYELRWWSHDGSDADFVSAFAEDESDFIAPAYDLGYLLRKLPLAVEISRKTTDGQWKSTAYEMRMITEYADTPEDAVCKLAIELFKQGMLKRGQS